MNCAEWDSLLCDFVDGVLHGPEKSAFEAHLAACPGCAEMHREVTFAVRAMERAGPVEPPAELLTRILHAAPSTRQPWYRRIFGGWAESILQPRYVMGMAMTMVSFSMIARFSGIQPRQLRPADLDPAKIWMAVDDRAQRGWDRAMKYYENLRWVLEVQSRFKEWSEQEQEQQKNSEAESKSNAGREAGAKQGKP